MEPVTLCRSVCVCVYALVSETEIDGGERSKKYMHLRKCVPAYAHSLRTLQNVTAHLKSALCMNICRHLQMYLDGLCMSDRQ